MGGSARCPSAWTIESWESFHPWFRIPRGERDRYSTKPSPSMSPYSSIHRNAASAAGKSFWAKSRSPVHRKCCAYRIRNQGVASTEPTYGVWGTMPAFQLSLADLMGDPAGLLVAPVVDHGPLPGG